MSKILIPSKEVKVAAIGKKGGWLSIMHQACIRRGYTDVTQIYEDIDKITSLHQFDVVFVDDELKPGMSGPELLDELISKQLIPCTTAIILIGGEIKPYLKNYDLGIHVIDFIELPLSEKIIVTTLERSLTILRDFKITLNFIQANNFAFALKSLRKIPKKQLNDVTSVVYYRLFVNISIELGSYKEVLQLCDSTLLTEQRWTIWSKLKAYSEMGAWNEFEKLVEDEQFTALPEGSSKLVWQLRSLLQDKNYVAINEMIENAPNHKLSAPLLRLNYSILVFRGLWEQAESFVKNRLKLEIDNHKVIGEMLLGLCHVYMFQFFITNDRELQKKLIGLLKHSLYELRSHGTLSLFKNEIRFLDVVLLIATDRWKEDDKFLKQLEHQIQTIESESNSYVMTSRLAYAWLLLGNSKKAFECLIQADIGFTSMPFGLERLILLICHKTTFNSSFAISSRSIAYRKLGDNHVIHKRYKLACKAYVNAIENCNEDNTDLKKRLLKVMKIAHIEQFSGYRLSKSAVKPKD